MKKSILTALVLCLVFAGQAIGSTYTLDIALNTTYDGLEDVNKIGGVEFKINGAYSGVELGNATPLDGNWVFWSFGGGWATVIDDYDYNLKDYAPLLGGTILTLTSEEELTFSDLGFFDFEGKTVESEHFTTEGFMATVPVPGAVWLLGSGLAGLFGVVRRSRKTMTQ